MSTIQGNPSMSRMQNVIDSSQAKAEVAKVNTPNQTKATNLQFSYEASRQAIDAKPPGEAKAQFKDNYNPASTILRGQETDQREAGDQRLKDNKDRHGKGKGGYKHNMNPNQLEFPTSTLDRVKKRLEVLGLYSDELEKVLDKMEEEDLNKLLKAVCNSTKSTVETALKTFLKQGILI